MNMDNIERAVAILDNIATEASFYTTTPLEKGPFNSYEETLKYVGEFAASDRFALKKSACKDKKDDSIRICYLKCDKAGKPKEKKLNDNKLSRNTRSKKTNCKYQIRLSRKKSTGEWTVALSKNHNFHNHPRSSEKIGLISDHKLTEEEYQIVCGMADDNKSRAEILEHMNNLYYNKNFTYNQIHNIIHKYKRKLALCKSFF